eukprot:scaffold90061_cov66-Phaeocystis_antarctica.AAC.12
MSAVSPRLVGRSTLAPCFSSSLTIFRRPWIAAACSRVDVEVQPSSSGAVMRASTDPPLRSHLTTVCSSPHSADRMISSGSEVGELTTGSSASGGAAGEAGAGCSGAACCWMSCAVFVWPLVSAHCRAASPSLSSSSVLALAPSRAFTHASCPPPAADIRAVPPSLACRSGSAECWNREASHRWSAMAVAVWPSSSSSSVLALARSRACTHASCPLAAASNRAVLPLLDCRSGLAECCSRRSTTGRWPLDTAFMSVVQPALVGKSTLAPRISSSLTISRWPESAAICIRARDRPSSTVVMSSSTSPPLRSHLTTFCSLPRNVARTISTGTESGELIAARGSLGAAGATDSGGPTCERAAARARRPSPGRRRRVAQREAEQSAQPATGGGSFIHSRSNNSYRNCAARGWGLKLKSMELNGHLYGLKGVVEPLNGSRSSGCDRDIRQTCKTWAASGGAHHKAVDSLPRGEALPAALRPTYDEVPVCECSSHEAFGSLAYLYGSRTTLGVTGRSPGVPKMAFSHSRIIWPVSLPSLSERICLASVYMLTEPSAGSQPKAVADAREVGRCDPNVRVVLRRHGMPLALGTAADAVKVGVRRDRPHELVQVVLPPRRELIKLAHQLVRDPLGRPRELAGNLVPLLLHVVLALGRVLGRRWRFRHATLDRAPVVHRVAVAQSRLIIACLRGCFLGCDLPGEDEPGEVALHLLAQPLGRPRGHLHLRVIPSGRDILRVDELRVEELGPRRRTHLVVGRRARRVGALRQRVERGPVALGAGGRREPRARRRAARQVGELWRPPRPMPRRRRSLEPVAALARCEASAGLHVPLSERDLDPRPVFGARRLLWP